LANNFVLNYFPEKSRFQLRRHPPHFIAMLSGQKAINGISADNERLFAACAISPLGIWLESADYSGAQFYES
jgi:hypothetical protein